jgi:hypothetical protein
VISLDITQCHERSVPKLSQLRDCESDAALAAGDFWPPRRLSPASLFPWSSPISSAPMITLSASVPIGSACQRKGGQSTEGFAASPRYFLPTERPRTLRVSLLFSLRFPARPFIGESRAICGS